MAWKWPGRLSSQSRREREDWKSMPRIRGTIGIFLCGLLVSFLVPALAVAGVVGGATSPQPFPFPPRLGLLFPTGRESAHLEAAKAAKIAYKNGLGRLSGVPKWDLADVNGRSYGASLAAARFRSSDRSDHVSQLYPLDYHPSLTCRSHDSDNGQIPRRMRPLRVLRRALGPRSHNQLRPRQFRALAIPLSLS